MSEGVRGAPVMDLSTAARLALEILQAGLAEARRSEILVARRGALAVAALALLEALDRTAPGLKAEIGRALRPCVEFDDAARRARERDLAGGES